MWKRDNGLSVLPTCSKTTQEGASKDVKSGFSFQKCNISASSDLDTTTVNTYLGRPWGIYSTVAVLQSFIGDLVDPACWTLWKGETGLTTMYYREYQNRDPRAVTSKRVTWSGFRVIIDAKEATKFTVTKLLDGKMWLKASRISLTFTKIK